MKEVKLHSAAKLSLWLMIAVVSAALAVVTAVIPHWLESVFGLDPDGGNGSSEWLIVAAAAAVSVLASVRVRLSLAR